MKKIAKDTRDDWKHKNNINLRKKDDKISYQNYLDSFKISIFDFLYCMRIRSNYREFAFIDDVTTDETAKYFNAFFAFTFSFVESLESMKKDLIKMRT